MSAPLEQWRTVRKGTMMQLQDRREGQRSSPRCNSDCSEPHYLTKGSSCVCQSNDDAVWLVQLGCCRLAS